MFVYLESILKYRLKSYLLDVQTIISLVISSDKDYILVIQSICHLKVSTFVHTKYSSCFLIEP